MAGLQTVLSSFLILSIIFAFGRPRKVILHPLEGSRWYPDGVFKYPGDDRNIKLHIIKTGIDGGKKWFPLFRPDLFVTLS
jgi:hypothetical protein